MGQIVKENDRRHNTCKLRVKGDIENSLVLSIYNPEIFSNDYLD